jgi:NAD-dependent dihydropyrimidine dehydrogenase PreA subunit
MQKIAEKANVEIIEEQCKACEICVLICPKKCIKLNVDKFNANGFHPAIFRFKGEGGECNACGLCYFVCPDYAITKIKVLQ